MIYYPTDTKATPASASIFRLIWISLLHNVVKRARSLLSNGKQGLFTWVFSGRGVMLTTYLHLVPRLMKEWSYTSTAVIRHHGVVLI
jgi:hypothetical protein